MVNDVKRAYFFAPAKRPVYVELPPEDWEPGKCGRLCKSMYGTRDAAANWQDTLMTRLEDNGLQRGAGYPCVFFHPGRSLWTMAHGDDYVSAGRRNDLQWPEGILKAAYEIQTQHIGPSCKWYVGREST